MTSERIETNICGLVVHLSPHCHDAVCHALAQLPGVDVFSHAHDHRLIVTVHDTEQAMAIDQITAINRLPGVVSTTLAYHLIEDPDAVAPCAVA